MELGGERARPAAVAPRMDLHPDTPAALAQLQSPGPAGDAEVPVAPAFAASQVTLAPDHEPAPFALQEDLLGAEVDRQLQHGTTLPRGGYSDGKDSYRSEQPRWHHRAGRSSSSGSDEMNAAAKRQTPGLRNPREIPVYVVCAIVNVLIAVALVGGAIVELAPTPLHALVIASTPLRIAVASILLAAFVVGLLLVLVRQLTCAASRGGSVLATPGQFPEIDAMKQQAAARLGFRRQREPEIYVTAGNGVLNAFAASSFGHDFVVVHSDLFANTLEQNRRALRFIVGHELGHIRLGHTGLWYQLSIAFSGLVPLLGPYLSRLRELSCDRHGAWFEPEGADGLVLLTAGRYVYRQVRLPDLLDQARRNVGFWDTVAQLQLSHPFSVRRIAELNRLGLIRGSSPRRVLAASRSDPPTPALPLEGGGSSF